MIVSRDWCEIEKRERETKYLLESAQWGTFHGIPDSFVEVLSHGFLESHFDFFFFKFLVP